MQVTNGRMDVTESPGWVWWPTVSMMLVSLISYIDRNTLALLAPTILKDTGLTAEQYGFVISAFSIAYMIGNPVWGMALDRFGLRRGMTASVSLWTIASAAHAFAAGVFSFGAARAVLGFGEGATFPGGLRTSMQTLPAEKRSRGIAVSYSGGSLGALITPIIVTPIAAWFGWRAAFWFTGLVGLAWLALWLIVSRRVRDSGEPVNTARFNFRDPRAWAFMSVYGLGALPLGFVIYGASIFLSRARGLNQVQIGSLLWIPPLGWELGYFFWGWISDRFMRRGDITYRGCFVMLTVLSLPIALLAEAPVLVAMAGMFFAMFVAAGFVMISIAYASDEFPPSQSGLIAGLGAGSWSALVAVVMPMFGRLFDQSRWGTAFGIAAMFPVVSLALWWWADSLVRRRG